MRNAGMWMPGFTKRFLTGLMEKVNRLINPKFSVMIDATTENKNVKRELSTLNNKIQQLLLWSNICALWSYIMLFIVIARLYSCFEGKQQFMMIGSLGTIYVLLGILLWFAWKGTVYKESDLKKAGQKDLSLQVGLLVDKSKSLSSYLVLYIILLVLASIYFFLDIHNGLTLIVKVSAPIGTIAFLTGIYFMRKFKEQNTALQTHLKHFKV